MKGTPAAAVAALRRPAPADRDPADPNRPTHEAVGLRPSLMVQRRANEPGEERMGFPRARAELGVELPRHEPRMPRQLDDLHQLLLRPDARDAEPAPLQRREIVVVDLVSVAVALLDGALAVEPGGRAPLPE